MTLAEINNIADLFAKAGTRIPVCPHEWRELQMLKVPATELTIDSDFALLDVKKGRHKLAKKMPPGSGYLPDDERIPIAIYGYISHQHGSDDGTSIEFGVAVERVVIERDLKAILTKESKVVATKSIGKATVKDGKLKPVVKQSASQKAAGHKKAARVVKGLKANRASSKANRERAKN